MRYSKPIFPAGDEPSSRAEMLRGYKAFLKREEAFILLKHRATKEGLRICQERTELIDHVLRNLWKDLPALMDPPLKTPPAVCLMATGGYARGIMNRHSDIDLNFLVAGNSLNISPAAAQFVGAFNLFLTDLGCKVGHITDCVGGRLRQANEDNLTKTSLIVTRYLIGATEPYEQLQARFVKECIAGQEVAFLRTQLEEMVRRHARQENTPFVQQPDVKEGCGGLRDYQTLIWVSFAKLRISDLSQLQGLKMLDRRSWNELRRAHDFILRVRNEMHYHEHRAQDRLGLKLQGPVATKLGYKGKRMIDRIEAFMQDYYMHVRNVLRQSSKLLDRFNIEVMEQGEPQSLASSLLDRLRRKPARSGAKEKTEHFDDFHAKHGRIFADSDRVFASDPHRLMRLFMHTQQRHLRLSPDLFDLVCNTSLVNTTFRYDKIVRETFLGLLDHKGDVARVLRQMHRCDFLGRYLPEFGALTCRVQHEFFHSYTADEHTLRCIDHLDELAGKAEKSLEFYQQLFREMLDPSVLYLALLMHDTGRAANKATHSEESTMLADKVCRRLQIKGERRNQLLFLVDNHLLMYTTATKKNPDEPEVIREFAAIVKTRANLDALMLMTMADVKGVGGNAFTGFKDISLRGLYYNTVRFFDAPADFMKRATVALDDLKDKVMTELGKGFIAEAEAHFTRMPRAYFNFRKPSTIANHLRQFRAFFEQLAAADDSESALLPLLRWEDKPAEGCSKLVVCGWDRHLLLARVAGALAAEGLSIISADFYQRSDHLVLDVFRVSTTNFEPVTGEGARRRVQRSVHEALRSDDFDFSSRIAARRKPVPGIAEIEAEIPQWVYINNNISTDHTVVELQAIDRIGLLYDVFTTIGRLGFSVTHARIGTERGVAVDAIYLQDVTGSKISDREIVMQLKQQLGERVLGSEK